MEWNGVSQLTLSDLVTIRFPSNTPAISAVSAIAIPSILPALVISSRLVLTVPLSLPPTIAAAHPSVVPSNKTPSPITRLLAGGSCGTFAGAAAEAFDDVLLGTVLLLLGALLTTATATTLAPLALLLWFTGGGRDFTIEVTGDAPVAVVGTVGGVPPPAEVPDALREEDWRLGTPGAADRTLVTGATAFAEVDTASSVIFLEGLALTLS